MTPERRKFLMTGSIALATVAALSRTSHAAAQAKAAPHVSEGDAQAVALGYKNDAAKADKKKFANWKAGETCSGCAQFEGKAGDAWAPCKIFPGKQVSGKGWCTAFAKKA
jgi:hypothetical protein